VIEQEHQGPRDKAPAETYKDITRIMNTEIKTCPTIGEGPQYHRCCQQSATNEPPEEDGEAEGVGGMGREEAIASSTIAIHDIYQHTYLRVMGRPPSGNSGFDNLVIDSPCDEDT
jgi:hypothetical protein